MPLALRLSLRPLLACLFLGAQGVGIIAARFGPERYFCWAPYDEITLFEITVTVGSRILAPEEVQARYQLPDPRRDNRSWAHVPRAISQYERTLGVHDKAYVEFRYTVNGGPPRLWTWPESARGTDGGR